MGDLVRRRRCRRRAGADGEHSAPLRGRQIRNDVRAVGRMRCGRCVPAGSRRHRLRPRRPAGDARDLGGCAGIRGLAVGDDGKAVPAAERGRMGVRGAGGKRDARFPWGDDVGRGNANCDGCRSRWDDERTAPVGSLPANAFGVHEMVGNVYEWVEDCGQYSYEGAPSDGSAIEPDAACRQHMMRGGSWLSLPRASRPARTGSGPRWDSRTSTSASGWPGICPEHCVSSGGLVSDHIVSCTTIRSPNAARVPSSNLHFCSAIQSSQSASSRISMTVGTDA